MKGTAKFVFVFAVMFAAGCTTAVKQVVYAVRGPQGETLVIEAEPREVFEKYQKVEVTSFENKIPEVIPETVTARVQSETVTEIGKKGIFTSGASAVEKEVGEATEPTLVVSGKLLDISTDEVPGQKIIGSPNHLIAQVEVKDRSSGKVLARANVRGVVKSAVDFNVTSLATGLGRGIEKLLEQLTGRKPVEEGKKKVERQ